jgi:hypothetical protein
MLPIVLFPLLFVDFVSILFFEMLPIFFFPFFFNDTKQEKKLEEVFKLDKAPNLGIYFPLFSFYLG